MKIKLLIIIAFCSFLGAMGLQAQNTDADFARKIRPEYKVDLSPQKVEMPTAHVKTIAELNSEKAYYATQKSKTEAIIAEMDRAGRSKEDPDYVKYQLTLKFLSARLAETEKELAESER